MSNEIIPAHPAAFTLEPVTEAPPQPDVRHDGWTAQRQRQFCETLAECGMVEKAAAAAGMSRESAYKLRRRSAGKSFALAWDAALLLARQRLIDEAFALAFTGSVEQTVLDGEVIYEKRRRDPRMMLAMIERLSGSRVLGSAATNTVAQEFDAFLDCMEQDAAVHSGASADFLNNRLDDVGMPEKSKFAQASYLLRTADSRAGREEKAHTKAMLAIGQNSESV
jgi:hypothetical protein